MFGLTRIKLAAALVALVVAFGAGWKVEGWRWDASEKAAVQAALAKYQQETAQAAKASSTLAAQQEQNHAEIRTITRTVDRIVVRPVYRNVCLDADGLRAVNAALAGKAAAAGKPDGAVPAADAPR